MTVTVCILHDLLTASGRVCTGKTERRSSQHTLPLSLDSYYQIPTGQHFHIIHQVLSAASGKLVSVDAPILMLFAAQQVMSLGMAGQMAVTICSHKTECAALCVSVSVLSCTCFCKCCLTAV